MDVDALCDLMAESLLYLSLVYRSDVFWLAHTWPRWRMLKSSPHLMELNVILRGLGLATT